MPEDLKEKYKDLMPAPAPKKAVPTVAVSELCPECGGPMKLRQSTRGRKNWFLGCAKYPKCKGLREASPDLLEQLQEAGSPRRFSRLLNAPGQAPAPGPCPPGRAR